MRTIEDLINSSGQSLPKYEPKKKKEESRVLCVGDLHEPFCLDKYLDFCSNIYDKYNCNTVMFSGDILDNHFSSFHETCPDGLSAGNELYIARKRIHKWDKIFKDKGAKIYSTLGNHCLIILRKAYTGGLSKEWIKEYADVLEVDWEFSEEFIIDNVVYCHGTGGKARARAKRELCSIVQGHYHSESYVEYFVGNNFKIFALQVGCGINRKTYAMAYGKHFAKPAISCGVVIGGKEAHLEMMEL